METQWNVRSAVAVIGLAFACQMPVHAQDGSTVRGMAATCANCHSAESGDSRSIPAINSRDRGALLQQLKDFKSGARPATVMHQLARGFTDAQLEQLATWFANAEKR
ncbi:MAG: cytochrome [Betaproteobacteria bacterium]|nr:cytochrome [Betaproteobacteria bacterium]